MNTVAFLYDGNGKCVASISEDHNLFNVTGDNPRHVGSVRDGNIYDLRGNLIGHLEQLDIGSDPEAINLFKAL